MCNIMCVRVVGFLPQLQRWINKRKKGKKKEKREKKDKADKPNATPKRRSASNNSSSNAFDERNEDTFADSASDKGWSVADMFAANAKLTGAEYTYDGNPHRFGDMHPRYVRYEGLVSPMRTSTTVPDKDSTAMSARTKAAFGGIAEASEEVAEYFPMCFQFDMSAIHEALLGTAA